MPNTSVPSESENEPTEGADELDADLEFMKDNTYNQFNCPVMKTLQCTVLDKMLLISTTC